MSNRQFQSGVDQINTFLKIAQAGILGSFGFRLFSIASSALGHLAAALPSTQK